MRTLLDRLNPEYKVKLIQTKDLFENMHDIMIVELSNLHYVCDLKLETAKNLRLYLDVDIEDIYNAFED